MKVVNSISTYISQTLYESNSISQEEIPIYNYCLSYFFESLIYCIYIVFLALILGQIINGFLIILIFLPLKILAGGYHAKSQKQCYFLSYGSIPCIFFVNFYFHITFTIRWIILYTICSIFIIFLAPIDTENKKISKDKRNILKKYTMFYIVFLTALSQLLLWAKCYQNYIIFSICICIININQLIGLLSNWTYKKGEKKHELKSSTLR